MPRPTAAELARLGVAAATLAAAVTVGVVRPPGGPSASAAALDAAPTGLSQTLASVAWGGGRLVLVGTATKDSDRKLTIRKLTIAFVADDGRGWRAKAVAVQSASKGDVAVASLVVTSSRGGHGQPAWTAVYGELGDPRITRVEVSWTSGPASAADRQPTGSYMVVRAGKGQAASARFLAADGSVVATVPVG